MEKEFEEASLRNIHWILLGLISIPIFEIFCSIGLPIMYDSYSMTHSMTHVQTEGIEDKLKEQEPKARYVVPYRSPMSMLVY